MTPSSAVVNLLPRSRTRNLSLPARPPNSEKAACPAGRSAPDVLACGGSEDPVHLMSHRISPTRAHVGPSLLGRRALEVPQAQEAHDPAGDEDRAGQEEGEFETPEE